MIKARETIHKGYRFRSRLEARWAVFLDGMGIEYEYEKEGYDLGEHGWYLPDFWLPDFKVWMEIKPAIKGKASNDTDDDKLIALRNMTGHSTLMCIGYPKKLWNYLYTYNTNASGGGSCQSYSTFAADYSGEPVILVNSFDKETSMYNTSSFEDLGNILTLQDLVYRNNKLKEDVYVEELEAEEFFVFDILDKNTKSCEMALRARQARFEHGEYNKE